jgi:regulator of ribonuclease activity A
LKPQKPSQSSSSDTAIVTWSTCDLSDAHGDDARVLPGTLRHFGGADRFTGTIETLKCFEDNSRVKELVESPGDGRVLLVDAGASTRYALLGDNLARAAEQSGWVGIVIHGCVRDTAELRGLPLGVMAIGSTPRRSLKNGEGLVGIPIEIAGVRCVPGDVLFADEDGAIVIAASSL